jgi:hypothetical protein
MRNAIHPHCMQWGILAFFVKTAIGTFFAAALITLLSERVEGMMCAKTAPA